jgi:signal transduction histidine kinase
VAINTSPIRDETGVSTGVAVVARDLSGQVALLQQAGRADKLDTMGQLAAGIAHDVANVLTAVAGFTRVAAQKAGAGVDVSGELAGIERAASSGSRLVHRLLGFAQPRSSPSVVFDVVAVVDDLLPVLRQLAGPGLGVTVRRAREALPVRGDANQLEQVLANLVVNGRDAMAGRGTIGISLSRFVLVDPPATTFLPLPPGAYAAVTVSDTGSGMDDVTLRRCVEPFFTTKPAGVGTGLGLASVASVLRANAGSLDIHSTPGAGTKVTVYWPLSDQGAHSPVQETRA